MKLRPVRSSALWISALCGSTAVLLWASQTWITKDFKDWTEKDASAVVTESPWAKVMPLPSTDRPEQVILDGALNGGQQATGALGTNSGNNSTTGANQGSENGNAGRATVLTPSTRGLSTGAPAIQPTLTVIWASALPVRLAELKLRTKGTQPTETQVRDVEKPHEHYVVVVVGLPAPDDLAQVNALAATSSLDSHGKTIPCIASDFRQINEHNVYIFRFPKTRAFTLDDRDVEFRVTLGRMQIKKKFDLRDMIYQGKLAL